MTEFDYIVVGAGSAGCVVANRLSADPRRSVLLIEAGGTDRRWRVQLPIGYGLAFYDPSLNWMYRTEPDPALAGRSGYWPRGKVLGGSSAINAMVYVWGQAPDFEHWRALGNPGWGWKDVLPYFKRMESSSRTDDALRGRDGPLEVSDVSSQVHPLCQSFLRAGEQLGWPRSPGFNGAQFEGVGIYEITAHRGRRMSSARAWLHPAMGRANLVVQTDALASEIVIEGGRATGLRYRRAGRAMQARARREVILCAGSIGSPMLLQRSGVGPGALLQSLGIEVKRDSPAVGRHLQDHLCIDHLYRARVPTLNQELGPWAGKVRAALRYVTTLGGPLALSVNQAGGFVRSRPELEYPDMQLFFSPLSYTRAPVGERPLMSPDPFPGFLVSAQPCRPTSRGHLQLGSTDPAAPPVIVPNSLATAGDLELMLRGAAILRRLAAAPALADVIAEELAPGRGCSTREQMVEDIRQRASTVFHPVSTCRMGPDPREAVVDERLRVHGLGGLRVIDASVFPALTSGNINAPTLMVAERGAEFVLADEGRAAR